MKWVEFRNAVELIFGEAIHGVEIVAPIAAAAGAIAGQPEVTAAATAAGALAKATDKAIADHEAAGQTAQSGVSALAGLAQTVAEQSANLGIDPQTAAKINSIAEAAQTYTMP